MAFVLKKTDRFFWPVKIKSPRDGGGYDEQVINLEFKKLGNKELRALGQSDTHDLADLCKAIVTGWKDVKDENGNEVLFSQEGLDELLDIAGISIQIIDQFREALAGAAAKN